MRKIDSSSPQPTPAHRQGLGRRLRLGAAVLRWRIASRLPASPRQLVIVAHDLVVAALSFAMAVILRFGTTELGPERIDALVQGVPLFTLVAGLCFLYFGVHREVWRYASTSNLLTIMQASTVAVLVFFLISFTVDRTHGIPRSVPLIQWFVLIVMLGGPRFLYRLLVQYRGRQNAEGMGPIPVLLVGAEEGAALFLRALQHETRQLYRAVGILDMVRGDRGRQILDVPVLGTVEELPRALRQLEVRGLRPQKIVVTVPLGGERMRELVTQAERHKLTVCRLPSLTDFRQAFDDGRLELRPVQLEDLLGRPQVVLDQAAIDALVHGRRVLITGAGGSIGSELVRQIARLGPARLVLMDSGEYNLYAIDHEIAARHTELPRAALLCDVRDRERVARIFAEHQPELVFHAAALKHVPLVELNPPEGVLTNVMGTRNIADAALACGALAMVQISTDKAVNPTNVMGATKRLAEFYCQALDLEAPTLAIKGRPPTRFMTVRFGNVLGSSGSVVPMFQKQLEQGGPLTVTHPDIKRYFMTIREAVELVLQASAHGIRDDAARGRIFVLDMGEPVRIVDVARQMIRLAGLEPEKDVAISIVGLRPGEKLYEELFDTAEQRLPAVVPGVMGAVFRSIEIERLLRAFEELGEAARQGDEAAIRAVIARIIPGYASSLAADAA
ncbi:nucleoside-diphosphate sugar epimerase/dehydratase [Geminicoccaceae bacterium 1502E]|nr:nucleoside-diphosphate sugar epimerase/dehydratase [Geminicoccaceae bacterium 1502E]